MRLRALLVSFEMNGRELARNRLAMLLLFLVPSLFFLLMVLTTRQTTVAFKVGSLAGEPVLQVNQRSEALVFIGVAAVGLIAAFLGLNLVQRQLEVNRRLILCGCKSTELATAKLAVSFCVTLLVGAYVTGLLRICFPLRHPAGTILGLLLTGYVYGTYGMFVGSLLRRELEGILLVVLLVNIDAGWLQNPLYYADAQNQAIIRFLPAFFPSQLTMISAFSNLAVTGNLLGGFLYGTGFLLLAFGLLWLKTRMR
jgi:ABC-2 type transport system permease protein